MGTSLSGILTCSPSLQMAPQCVCSLYIFHGPASALLAARRTILQKAPKRSTPFRSDPILSPLVHVSPHLSFPYLCSCHVFTKSMSSWNAFQDHIAPRTRFAAKRGDTGPVVEVHRPFSTCCAEWGSQGCRGGGKKRMEQESHTLRVCHICL